MLRNILICLSLSPSLFLALPRNRGPRIKYDVLRGLRSYDLVGFVSADISEGAQEVRLGINTDGFYLLLIYTSGRSKLTTQHSDVVGSASQLSSPGCLSLY